MNNDKNLPTELVPERTVPEFISDYRQNCGYTYTIKTENPKVYMRAQLTIPPPQTNEDWRKILRAMLDSFDGEDVPDNEMFPEKKLF
jgi:hypothetical protein